jgi:hypothetical protein
MEVTRDSYAQHARIPALPAAHPAFQHAARVYALVESGQVGNAGELGEQAYRPPSPAAGRALTCTNISRLCAVRPDRG